MVAIPINPYIGNRIYVSNICRFCSCPLYIFIILMKSIIDYIKCLGRQINKAIVFIALLATYFIICIYHLFVDAKAQRWHKCNNKTTLEQSKHLW